MAGNKIIAVDFGGTSIRAALMSGRRILRLVKHDTMASEGKNVVLKQLVKAIEEAKGVEKIKGIGIGSPGPLLDGVIKNPPNLPIRNFNLKKFLQKKFKTRIEIENDAKCAALAELVYGVKKKNFIVLTLGTGIGGGVIIDGSLYKGQGYGGEIGHIIIQDEKDLEYWASGTKIKKDARIVFGKEYLAGELKKLNNKKADKILRDAAEKLGIGIGSLVNAFDPEVVILVGGLKDAGNEYISIVRKEAQKYSILPKKVNVQWSKLKNSGILGAGLLLKK
ncbi:MAG: ROK family protein [Nanoarchaeota archaeon]|nr:ROK family protein [Nanoarchaeota archaeon]